MPTDRALRLIGYEGRRLGELGRPEFEMSEEQARVLSCLLEIDLTLVVMGFREDLLHRRSDSPVLEGAAHSMRWAVAIRAELPRCSSLNRVAKRLPHSQRERARRL